MSERPNSEVSARQLGKLVLRAAPILGAGLVLAAACRGNEEVTHTPEDKNVPVTECLPGVTPIFESSDGRFDDNALDVGFLGDFVYPKVQEILEKYGACRFYTNVSGEDDPSNLFLVQGIEARDLLFGDLQKQVEAGNLLSVNLVPFGSTD